jgi:serine/threonine-protein kinase
MARSPEARHATAAELQAELQAYLAEEPDAPTMKDVAAVVTRIFAEDHARTRAAIDTCLAALRAGESEIIPAPLSANMHDATPSGANPYAEPTPSANVPPTPIATDMIEVTFEAPPAPRRGRLLAALMGGILLLALIGLGLRRSAEPSGDVLPVDAIAPPVAPPITADPAKRPAAPDLLPPATAAKPPVSILVNPASRRAQAGSRLIQGARPTATAPLPSPPPSMCNPPFYFEGTKKIYKPGCI